MNDAYGSLAQIYDQFTQDVDYAALFHYLKTVLHSVEAAPASVLDLACGTGSMSVLFASEGYQVIGADQSEEMLTVAAAKAADMANPPFFIRQQMQQLLLPQTVELCVCLLDSLNYLTEESHICQTFQRVFHALSPNGIFLFDVRTPSLLQSLDGQVFLDETDDAYCVWRGSFEDDILTYAMDIFTRSGAVWKRQQEVHEERAWDPDWLEQSLRQAGFSTIQRFGNRTLTPPGEAEERMFFLARKDFYE